MHVSKKITPPPQKKQSTGFRLDCTPMVKSASIYIAGARSIPHQCRASCSQQPKRWTGGVGGWFVLVRACVPDVGQRNIHELPRFVVGLQHVAPLTNGRSHATFGASTHHKGVLETSRDRCNCTSSAWETCKPIQKDTPLCKCVWNHAVQYN